MLKVENRRLPFGFLWIKQYKANPIIMDKNEVLSRISAREKEVIRLLAQGLTTKQIGQKLNISSTTVITHRNNLRDKLKCKNCPELIYRATQIGLLLNPQK